MDGSVGAIRGLVAALRATGHCHEPVTRLMRCRVELAASRKRAALLRRTKSLEPLFPKPKSRNTSGKNGKEVSKSVDRVEAGLLFNGRTVLAPVEAVIEDHHGLASCQPIRAIFPGSTDSAPQTHHIGRQLLSTSLRYHLAVRHVLREIDCTLM